MKLYKVHVPLLNASDRVGIRAPCVRVSQRAYEHTQCCALAVCGSVACLDSAPDVEVGTGGQLLAPACADSCVRGPQARAGRRFGRAISQPGWAAQRSSDAIRHIRGEYVSHTNKLDGLR